MLEAEGLAIGFGDTEILAGVDLALRALAGLLPVRRGRVTLADSGAAGRRAWSMVFQSPRLFPWRRVRANVELGLEGLALTRAQRRERAMEPLRLVGLADYAGRWPHTLSGGQQQRVGIARALAVRPQVLFMDEPFSALDAITRRRMQQELIDLRRRTEAAIVFVTHDIEEALLLADRVLVLGRGDGGEPAAVVERLEVPMPTDHRRDDPRLAELVHAVEARIGGH